MSVGRMRGWLVIISAVWLGAAGAVVAGEYLRLAAEWATAGLATLALAWIAWVSSGH